MPPWDILVVMGLVPVTIFAVYKVVRWIQAEDWDAELP